jgi:hypothetical protein
VYIGAVCDAQSSNNGANLRAVIYRFNPITATFANILSFPLTFQRGEAGGGVKLSVISFGAKVNASEVETQKLKLKLKLVGPGGESPIPIAGQGTKPR